jgi:4-hydroxy-tetrahydrodipicolinate synthase
MAPDLSGIIVPLLTPLTADDEVDLPALRLLVDRLISAGVSAVVADAGTSEFSQLSDEERRAVAETVIDQVAGRIPALVGVSTPGTRTTIAHAKHAESIGAQGVMVLPPYYAPVPFASIRDHYVAVSDAVSIPIMLYNNLAVTGTLLTVDQLAEIVEASNVRWLKLTTNHLEQVPAVLDRVGTKAVVFEGVDTLAFLSMLNGARGWVAGPANAIPELAIDLYRLTLLDPDLEAARALHLRLVPLLSCFVAAPGIYRSGIKEVCRLRGYELGGTRRPGRDLTDEERSRIGDVYRRAIAA